jgi:stage V sporulation protein B
LKKKIFVTNTIVLTVTSIIAKLIGIVFRSYMAAKVGAEGLGIYGLVCSVYSFFSSFAVSGVSLAITQLVSDYFAKDQKQMARSVFRRCLAIGFLVSLSLSFLLFYLSEFISVNIFMDKRSISSLKILSIGLPFLAFSACFRGYFYARQHIFQTASEQLVEQLFEIAIFAFLVMRIKPGDVEYACMTIVSGTVIAEAFSCLHSYLMYIFNFCKHKKNFKIYFPAVSLRKDKVLRKILKISIPNSTNSFVKTGLSAAKNIMIPIGLKEFGASTEKSLADYGMIRGMVSPVISFPAVLMSAFSNLLIPEISRSNAINDYASMGRIISKIIKFTLHFSIFFAGVFWFWAKFIGKWIYQSHECAIYISILAPIVPFAYLSGILESVLKGLNEQVRSLVYNFANSIVKVLLIFILLPIKGVIGLIIMMFSSEFLYAITMLFRVIKITKLDLSFKNDIVLPIVCMFIACTFSNFVFSHMQLNYILIFFILFITSLTLYCTTLNLIKVLK